MTDKQIIIDENEINPNDWLEPYKPIPACEIKDCEHWVYAGNNVYGCRIAEDGLVCDDFNNDDECCMYRQLEYYKEALKAKEQECEKLETARHLIETSRDNWEYRAKSKERECESLNRWLPIISRLEMDFGSYEKAKAIDLASYTKQIFAELDQLKKQHEADKGLITATGKMNYQLLQEYDRLKTENEQLKNNDVFSVRYFKDKNDELKAENDKLKQRIKEQAKELWDKTTQIRTLTSDKDNSVCDSWDLDMLGY